MAEFSTFFSNIPADMLSYFIVGLHFLMGLLATAVAYSKGRNLKLWLFVGLAGGTAALFVALLMKHHRVISPVTSPKSEVE